MGIVIAPCRACIDGIFSGTISTDWCGWPEVLQGRKMLGATILPVRQSFAFLCHQWWWSFSWTQLTTAIRFHSEIFWNTIQTYSNYSPNFTNPVLTLKKGCVCATFCWRCHDALSISPFKRCACASGTLEGRISSEWKTLVVSCFEHVLEVLWLGQPRGDSSASPQRQWSRRPVFPSRNTISRRICCSGASESEGIQAGETGVSMYVTHIVLWFWKMFRSSLLDPHSYSYLVLTNESHWILIV